MGNTVPTDYCIFLQIRYRERFLIFIILNENLDIYFLIKFIPHVRYSKFYYH